MRAPVRSAAGRSAAAFVRGRRAGWERLAALSARAATGRLSLAEVEELSRLYRLVSAELAFARGRFPGSDAEGYLAQVVASAYRVLAPPPAPGPALLRLVRQEIPAAARDQLPALALAAALLGAGMAAGALAVALDPRAAELLLPATVREAVAAGRLWTGHLLSAPPGLAGATLLRNNAAVAALAFGLGLTAGLGTAALLLANGLLLGAVLAHSARHALAGQLLAFTAAHGPLELSALLLASQAGFVLAAALVDPGEWPRRAALQLAGRRAAPLLGVAFPALALAALLEATVSPAPALPALAKAALGLGLAAALWAWLLGRARSAPR